MQSFGKIQKDLFAQQFQKSRIFEHETTNEISSKQSSISFDDDQVDDEIRNRSEDHSPSKDWRNCAYGQGNDCVGRHQEEGDEDDVDEERDRRQNFGSAERVEDAVPERSHVEEEVAWNLCWRKAIFRIKTAVRNLYN